MNFPLWMVWWNHCWEIQKPARWRFSPISWEIEHALIEWYFSDRKMLIRRKDHHSASSIPLDQNPDAQSVYFAPIKYCITINQFPNLIAWSFIWSCFIVHSYRVSHVHCVFIDTFFPWIACTNFRAAHYSRYEISSNRTFSWRKIACLHGHQRWS